MALRIVFLLLLCSCAEGVIAGIGVSAVFFSKNDYTIFSSKMVYNARGSVSDTLKDNNHSTKSVAIVQGGDTVYAIGLVKSSAVKNRVVASLNTTFNKHFVDEISVNASGRNYTVDAYLKTRIRTKLLLTRFVKSQNYKILVYNQKAFVIGVASNKQEKEIVVNTLSKINYIDDIVAYIT